MRLEGTKVVVTGAFGDQSPEEVVAALEKRGAIVADGVAPDVEVVFAGDSPGVEADQARELGIRVADEEALKAALTGEEPAEKPPPPTDETPLAAPSQPTPPPVDEPASPGPSAGASGSEGAADRTGPQAPDELAEGEFGKGARVKIVGGHEGVGVVGNIFWWGESKFGEGMRAGVSGPDEETYWVDEEHLGWPDEEIPDEVLETAQEASKFRRGDEVRVKSGKDEGATGSIFWWGESKWGKGMRAGIETDDGEKVWVDAEHLEAVESEDDIPF